MSEESRFLGGNLTFEERISLAQLVNQPGWKILVHLMAEACRKATEAVIKLDPGAERYNEKLAGLQTTARAMNKFSRDVLDSVKLHQRTAVMEAQQQESGNDDDSSSINRFRLPIQKSPTEGKQ